MEVYECSIAQSLGGCLLSLVTRADLDYMNQLTEFHKQQGNSLTVPCFNKRPLDILKFKKAVETKGGYDSVCKTMQWAQLGRDLGYSGKIRSTISTLLITAYQTLIYPYEQYLRSIKPGDVREMIGSEHGGPFAQFPAPSATTRLAKLAHSTPIANGFDFTVPTSPLESQRCEWRKKGKHTCAFPDPGSC
jgi:histone demethylase JARID1